MMMKSRAEANLQHKVVLLGDSRVGKTSLLCYQLRKYKPLQQNPTIGCQCNELEMIVNDTAVSMQVWDTAGQEIYRALVPIYLRDAHAAIIVYDITDKQSFNSLPEWMDTLYGIFPPNSPVFFVANKTDLSKDRIIDDEQGREFAKKHNGQFFTASALSGDGIENIFYAVAEALLKTDYNENMPTAVVKESSGSCC